LVKINNLNGVRRWEVWLNGEEKRLKSINYASAGRKIGIKPKNK